MMDSKTVSTAQPQPKYFYCNNCLTNLPIFDDIETPATTRSLGGKNKLYYTNCSHVVCQACRTSINNCCPFCKRKAQMMQISRRMPRHMQMYFEPLRKSIQNVIKVAKFQKEQQRVIALRLVAKCNSIKMKVAAQKTENDKCNNSRKRILDGCKKVKQILTNFSDERQYVTNFSSKILKYLFIFFLLFVVMTGAATKGNNTIHGNKIEIVQVKVRKDQMFIHHHGHNNGVIRALIDVMITQILNMKCLHWFIMQWLVLHEIQVLIIQHRNSPSSQTFFQNIHIESSKSECHQSV